MAAGEVLGERLAHPAPLVAARHPVAAEQLLLGGEREPGDLPAHGEPLEQELHAALPSVLGRRRRLRLELLELAERPGAQLVAQRERVALGVAVLGRGRSRALALPAPAGTAAHAS